MGAYLSQPITDKETESGGNGELEFAVTAMQGWRTEMEDAHVCALDVEEGISLFGVFDGHGGKEVAKFVALHIVEVLRSTNEFQTGDTSMCLKEVYLALDALIRSEKSRSELLSLSAGQKTEREKSLERVINVDHLPKALREAICASRTERTNGEGDDDASDSDFSDFGTENGSSSDEEDRGKNVGSFPVILSDESSESESEQDEAPSKNPSEHFSQPDEGCSTTVHDAEPVVPVETSPPTEDNLAVPKKASVLFNTSDSTDSAECRSSDETGAAAADDAMPVVDDQPPTRVGLSSPNEKIEVISENCLFEERIPRAFHEQAHKNQQRRKTSVMGGLLSFVCPFPCLRSSAVVPDEDSTNSPSHSSDSATIPSTTSPVAMDTDESQLNWDPLQKASPIVGPEEIPKPIEEVTEGLESEELIELREEEDTNGRDVTVAGCTAVVAIVKGDVLFVANAGDSRCVLCHDGIALPMSRDHKPTDPEEYVRIKNAGGFVSDGRVNGCLNLSRALGDMEYKKSPDLAPEEYMITANPDVKTMDLQCGDHFLILACDGIWDVLSDQEACDFVRPRLQQNQSLDSITAELCDFCLAEDADGSGEGCDNMTAMIVLFKSYATENSTE